MRGLVIRRNSNISFEEASILFMESEEFRKKANLVRTYTFVGLEREKKKQSEIIKEEQKKCCTYGRRRSETCFPLYKRYT